MTVTTRAKIGITALLLAAAAVTVPVPAQQAAEEQPVFRVEVDMVVLSFTVTDNKGRYLNGLKPSDFEVFEDGIPQKMTTFSEGNQTPVRILEDGSTTPVLVKDTPDTDLRSDAFVGTNVFILFDNSNDM